MRSLPGSWKFRKRPPRATWLVILLIGLAAARACGVWAPTNSPSSSAPSEGLAAGGYPVARVVDGDTIIVKHAGRDVRLRLLGVDSPETKKENTPVQPWGPEATEFTEQFLRGGEVTLRMDRRRVDQYGRALAYVYVEEKMLNAELVRAGLARVKAYPGDSAEMTRLLKQAEGEAQAAKRGLWSR